MRDITKKSDTVSETEMVDVLKTMGCVEIKKKDNDIRKYNHLFLINDNISEDSAPGFHFVHVRRFSQEKYEYQFITYPFEITKFGRLIEDISDVELGFSRSLSGFTKYPKIDAKGVLYEKGGESKSGLGYAIIIHTCDGLKLLIERIRKNIDDGLLSDKFDKNSIRQNEDLKIFYRSRKTILES